MSIEIVYGRQFIRTSRGVLPLFLQGSSNCTMFHLGREIRERDWSAGTFLDAKEYTDEELLEAAEQYSSGKYADMELCRIQGKGNVTGAEFSRYIVNGLKHAKTMEQITEAKPGICLTTFLIWYANRDVGREPMHSFDATISTTKALEEWLDVTAAKAAELKSIGEADKVYHSIRFPTIKPLGIDLDKKERKPLAVPVFAKRTGPLGTYYVSEIECKEDGRACSYTYVADVRKAMTFESEEAAKTILSRFGRDFTFTAAEKEKEKVWALKIVLGSAAGSYVCKLTRAKMYHTTDLHHPAIKRFRSATEAESWAEKYLLAEGRSTHACVGVEAVKLDF